MVPCIGRGQRVAGRRRRRDLLARPTACGAALPRPRRPPPPLPKPAGQRHLEALAADLDDDGLARSLGLVRVRPPPANGSIGLSHSVSIQRVCTVNGLVAGEGRVADDGAVERQHGGHAVDDELVQRAAGALQRLLAGRAGRRSAWPAASRTRRRSPSRLDAGVHPHAGAARRLEVSVTVPGAGRKPRPASSPLIRNSIACPRGAGSSVSRSFSPSAIRNCSRTRSMPAVSSVTGCSTCSRVFTSRNEIGAVLADQVLDGAGAVVAGLLADAPWRCGGSARAARR